MTSHELNIISTNISKAIIILYSRLIKGNIYNISNLKCITIKVSVVILTNETIDLHDFKKICITHVINLELVKQNVKDIFTILRSLRSVVELAPPNCIPKLNIEYCVYDFIAARTRIIMYTDFETPTTDRSRFNIIFR